MGFFSGSRGKFKQKSLLGPEQQQLYDQLLASASGRGAGGAFGESADYYRDILSDDPEAFEAFAAPEMRRFNEDIIPGLSEQFAGMGSGALSSSGFRNAAVNAGTDLSERLGSIRARLRGEAARGLMDVGSKGLDRYNENVYMPGTPGFTDSIGQGIGQGLGAGISSGFGNFGSGWFSSKGKSSPYGNMAKSGANASFYGGFR